MSEFRLYKNSDSSLSISLKIIKFLLNVGSLTSILNIQSFKIILKSLFLSITLLGNMFTAAIVKISSFS